MADIDMATLEEFRQEENLSWAELELLLEWMKKPRFREEPASVRQFVERKDYMDSAGILYPKVMQSLEEINDGSKVECVLTGPIGTGKTSLALYTIAYQLHRLLCYEDPHAVFGLDPASEIVMVFQSISKKVAQDVDYQRFVAMVDRSPWFRGENGYDKNIVSELRFKNRIVIKPVHGGATGAIGQNVIGGVLDELNFMAIIADSKKNADGSEYNQALENYNSIAMRRASRFMMQGELPGMLCLVSSRRYKGQFTDQKEEEAKTNPRIYVYDEKVWTIKPDAFLNEWFEIFVGDETRNPFIIEEGDVIAECDEHLVMLIPTEYADSFDNDLMSALRDVAGVSTNAMHPFMVNTEAIAACFGKHKSIFSREDVDFVQTQLKILPKNIINPKEQRYIHIDLAFSKDSCGFAIGHVPGFTEMHREGDIEIMPKVHIDGVLEIKPPKNGEILFERVRSIIYKLTELGMKVGWVTFDQFQSKDSRQILAQKGYMTGGISMDKTTMGYEVSKTALYDGRVEAPAHAKCYHELSTLELDEKKGKVDHRPNGSKDCADAIGGVIWGLHRRREIWVRHKIPLQEIAKGMLRIAKTTQPKKADPSKGLQDIGE